MDPHEIDAIARELKQCFVERKTALYKRGYRMHPNHANLDNWRRAAVFCIELKATPSLYVDAAFAQCTLDLGPFPNMMCGSAAAGWYKSYRVGRADIERAETRSAATGRNVSFDPELSPDLLNLRADIDLVKVSLLRLTGTQQINEQTLPYISSFNTSYPPYVRVLLGYQDARVKKFFGQLAKDFFLLRPGMIEAARTLQYPIIDIIKWLNAPNN